MKGKDRKRKKVRIYEKYVKRVLDVTLAVIMLIVLFPILCVVHMLVKLEEPSSSAIFKQVRSGKDNKTFEVYKFRSMKSTAPRNMATEEFEDSEQYITKFGKFIRKTSIDELPQIVNIIKGDMSLVGPRPVICEERDLIEARQELGADSVLPGITGNAQIQGRDGVGVDKKAELDAEYCENVTFVNDLKLLFMTVPVVLLRRGNKDAEVEVPDVAMAEIAATNEERQTRRVPEFEYGERICRHETEVLNKLFKD